MFSDGQNKNDKTYRGGESYNDFITLKNLPFSRNQFQFPHTSRPMPYKPLPVQASKGTGTYVYLWLKSCDSPIHRLTHQNALILSRHHCMVSL
jgi:hypothetical protein